MENPISFRSSILEAVQSVQSQKRSSTPFALANSFSPQSPTSFINNRFSASSSNYSAHSAHAASASTSSSSTSFVRSPSSSKQSQQSQFQSTPTSPLVSESNSRHSFSIPPTSSPSTTGRRHRRKQSQVLRLETKAAQSRKNSIVSVNTSSAAAITTDFNHHHHHHGDDTTVKNNNRHTSPKNNPALRPFSLPVVSPAPDPAVVSAYSLKRASGNEAAHFDRFPIKVHTTPSPPTRSSQKQPQDANPERQASRSFSDKTITPRNVVAHSRQHPALDTEYEELLNSISARKGSRYSQQRTRMSLETASSTPSMTRSLSASSDESKPKSPGGSKLGAFFGWGGSSEPMPPQPPPKDVHLKRRSTTRSLLPSALDIPLANADHGIGPRSDSGIDMRPLTPGLDADLEDEIRTVSSDLASSIGRELELEELVEKLQMQVDSSGTLSASNNRRTSDYFSDAGTSSNAYNLDQDTSKAEVDYSRIIRKGEQEKAQLRLEMVQKVQEERDKRKTMVNQIRQLEGHLSKVNYAQMMSADAPGKIRELEYTVEDVRRKLREERKLKANFEDLFTASKEELEHLRNERDNLRDEVIPKIQAQLDNFESEASGNSGLLYENSQLQQQVNQLRAKNATLAETHRQITDMRQQQERNLQQQTTSPISAPSTPFKDKDSWLEKLKEIETQRDALQQSTRNLRMRLSSEMNRAEKRIQSMEQDKDASSAKTPRKIKKDAELSKLRRELDQLRARADDALAAKFTYEQGLDSIRLDLERAEQETNVLRALLKDKDALLHEADELKEANRHLSRQLRNSETDMQSESLKRAMEELKDAAAMAQQERDEAIDEAEAMRRRANSIEQEHMAEEVSLSAQLRDSAGRVEDLATQVRQQLESNNALRTRLAGAIQRGEQDQLNANTKLNRLQGKIKGIEEKVIMAQQKVDDASTEHDLEVRDLKESHNSQLRRIKGSLAPSPRTPHFKSPLPSPRIAKSPLMELAPSKPLSNGNEMRSQILEHRVTQLEQALGEADNEMEGVISRLNMAQIEVAELRNERDNAVQQTRKLQTRVEAQRNKYLNWMN